MLVHSNNPSNRLPARRALFGISFHLLYFAKQVFNMCQESSLVKLYSVEVTN